MSFLVWQNRGRNVSNHGRQVRRLELGAGLGSSSNFVCCTCAKKTCEFQIIRKPTAVEASNSWKAFGTNFWIQNMFKLMETCGKYGNLLLEPLKYDKPPFGSWVGQIIGVVETWPCNRNPNRLEVPIPYISKAHLKRPQKGYKRPKFQGISPEFLWSWYDLSGTKLVPRNSNW